MQTVAAAIVWCVAQHAAPASAPAQSPPPQALPLHSALPEDWEAPGALPPQYVTSPSVDGPYFAPFPPLDGEPTFKPEPPPAPWFSWQPTYVPPEAKDGALQQWSTTATYLPRFNDGGFGVTDLNMQAMIAVPPFYAGSPIMPSPSASVHFLDGPTGVDLPSEVYTFEFEFRYLKQVTSRFGMFLGLGPSYYGDLNNDSEAWRLTGKALFAYDWTPTLQIVGGGLLLGREDYPALPVGGVIWKATPHWRFEAVFPRPRVFYRYATDGIAEHRVYLGGEFGGNTWAIDHSDDTPDKFTYSDLRMVLGWERTVPKRLNARFELGWVFNREIEFTSGRPGFSPNDTIMTRGELSY